MTADARIERLKPFLVCPGCGGSLAWEREAASCQGCAARYPVRNGRIYFVSVPDRSDELDEVKGKLKHLLGRKYYTIGVRVLAPTYPFNFGRYVRRFVDAGRCLVIDAGSGNNRVDEGMVCLDVFDYPEVDVVCNLDSLPFREGSVDAFVSRSVLEHVSDPWKIVSEFLRCTRPGGLGLHVIPFLFPLHASPADFHRFSHAGAARLFEGWRVLEQVNVTGPVTAALLCSIEFFSSLLGGGHPRLKAWLYLIFCLVLFPVKYLDFPFVGRKRFAGLAPSLLTVVRKP